MVFCSCRREEEDVALGVDSEVMSSEFAVEVTDLRNNFEFRCEDSEISATADDVDVLSV